MFLIIKKFKFDAAHKLIDYKGECENLHGHTYFLEVTYKGKKKGNGIVVDFTILKEKINELIIKRLDHSYINDIIKQPTAENILEWTWNILKDTLNEHNVQLYEIKLWEGPNSISAYRGGADFR